MTLVIMTLLMNYTVANAKLFRGMGNLLLKFFSESSMSSYVDAIAAVYGERSLKLIKTIDNPSENA